MPNAVATGPPARVLRPTLVALAGIPIAFFTVGVFVAVGVAAGVGRTTSEAIGVAAGSAMIVVWGLALTSGIPAHRQRTLRASKGTFGGAIAVGIAGGIVMLVAAGAIVAGGAALDSGVKRRIDEAGVDLGGSIWRAAIIIVAIVVLAPVGEEVLFRGLVLRTLARRFTFGVSAVITSLAFAASHIDAYAIWPRAIALMVLGLGLAWVYRRRGLAASIAAHATINGVAVISSFLGP